MTALQAVVANFMAIRPPVIVPSTRGAAMTKRLQSYERGRHKPCHTGNGCAEPRHTNDNGECISAHCHKHDLEGQKARQVRCYG